MKTIFLTAILSMFLSFSNYAQNNGTNLKVGDSFTIGKVNMNNYQHIKFPKDNFIIKKGGIVNYNTILGKKVEITKIKEKLNGDKIAYIKLKNGNRFFNSHKYIKVNVAEAIASEELLVN